LLAYLNSPKSGQKEKKMNDQNTSIETVKADTTDDSIVFDVT